MVFIVVVWQPSPMLFSGWAAGGGLRLVFYGVICGIRSSKGAVAFDL
jgi:hypothetical protein